MGDRDQLIQHGWKFEDCVWTHPLLPDYPLGQLNALIVDPAVQRMMPVLKSAVQLIRQWHGMAFGGDSEPFCWSLYYQSAPELAPIREALGLKAKQIPRWGHF